MNKKLLAMIGFAGLVSVLTSGCVTDGYYTTYSSGYVETPYYYTTSPGYVETTTYVETTPVYYVDRTTHHPPPRPGPYRLGRAA